MENTDDVFLQSIFDTVPDMPDRRFSFDYKCRRKRIIKDFERKERGEKHRVRAGHILLAVLIVSLLTVIGIAASASPEPEKLRKPDIEAYELLGVDDIDQLFVTNGLENIFYLGCDMSAFEMTEKSGFTDNYYRTEYKAGGKKLVIKQAVLYDGIPYLRGDDLAAEPVQTTVNGWNAVYFSTNYGTCGYVIYTGEYLLTVECNFEKNELDGIITTLGFREADKNDG